MSVVSPTSLRVAAPPREWPDPPDRVSPSSLSIIENCPRRWGLSNAQYPDIWPGKGYPPRIGLAALTGTVIHGAVEEITNALIAVGCTSVQDELAVSALKKLGGISAVVSAATEKAIHKHRGNPRLSETLQILEKTVYDKVPTIRSQVQALLSRIKLEPTGGKAGESFTSPSNRKALGRGSHSEVWLESADAGWHGKPDLITIRESSCEIRDFKTGEAKLEHEDQLKAYAFLWASDRARNPDGAPATALVLSYLGGDVEIPAPTLDDLAEIAASLGRRRASAIVEVASLPPPARPSAGACRYCDVRHLCDDYWKSSASSIGGTDGTLGPRWVDTEVRIQKRRGPRTWQVATEGGALPVGTLALLVLGTRDLEPRAGDRLRVLGAFETADANDEGKPSIPIWSTTKDTEVFRVAES